ncbi:MAG: hypothetical protein ACPF98_06265 [Prochlorococcaceae cyanobacterium]|jgi:hypothetical protein|nr:hypothetical protein [Synechococcus sp.]RCL62118.1 MAG: hypothetical protein DBW81_05770 [Synechococcus sp. MED-G67]CAK27936.1 Hypothetical protein SynRCC307_1033 [Synechococcus sp. RCC307]HCA61916.1 hypothetical protein [Synechococcales bacterium UBA8647]
MSNEHHQAGRRPDKATTERLNPETRPKEPLGQASGNEQHPQPNSKPARQHDHHSNIETLKQLNNNQS